MKTQVTAIFKYTLLAVMAPAGTQLEVPLPEIGQSGQKKYQVNLRSHLAPIQVMLINRDSDSTIPVVFPVPPTDDICLMPSPPSTPASLQRLPLSTSIYSTSNTISSYSVDLIDELMSTDVISLLLLSPRAGIDYSFNLDDNEGVCDLFDVQILNY
uniref:E2F transcription factor 5 n=1 Tax=Seriola lalandi dorsalis TaxID=1841481 RepID=A0A3B4X9X7_SERLL